MSYKFSESILSNLWFRTVVYTVVLLLIVIIQINYLNLISLTGFLPDLLLIAIVWISLFEGRFYGIILGFIFGLMFDLFSEDLVGSNALLKSSVAYLAGMFYTEGKEREALSGFKFLAAITLSAIINNFFYYLIYLDIRDFNFQSFFVQDIFVSTVYTAVIALIPMFFSMRLKR